MQFVANGPDIPDALLQAHEEGRVVFFCGAGISYPAGLPSFAGLVDSIYRRVGTPRTPIEAQAFDNYQYDGTLN
jgi:NAD-dependent SIR2 family protein deacetylase